MSRNASGTYSLPAGNPVVTGTTIASTWANTTLSDIATEMTDSLDRSGKGGMLSPLGLVDGSVAAPGLAFNNELSTGLYRPAANQLGAAVAGVQRLLLEGATAPSAKFTSGLAAGDAGADLLLTSTNTRTAGLLLDIQNGGSSRIQVNFHGNLFHNGVAGINWQFTNSETNQGITLLGNKAAADAGTDIVLNTAATRTNGNLLDVQNNASSRMNLTTANLQLTSTGIQFNTPASSYVQAVGSDSGISVIGNRSAASTTADVTIRGSATRTAGQLLDIQNNTTSKVQVDKDGQLLFQVAPVGFGTLQQKASDSAIMVTGNRNAASTTADVQLTSSATRTAGQLVDVINNATSKVDIGFDGVIHGPNVPQISQVTADDAVTGTTMQSVAGLSFAVAASANYEAEFFLEANTSATAIHQIQLTGPASPTRLMVGAQGIFGTTVSGFGAAAFSTSFQLQPANIVTEASCIVKLHLQNGVNAGTVQLQHASNTAGQTATIFKGSHVRWSRIDQTGKP